jgi:hypothetical protein
MTEEPLRSRSLLLSIIALFLFATVELGCTRAIVGETFGDASLAPEDDALGLDAIAAMDGGITPDAADAMVGPAPCTPCVSDSNCMGQICAQFGGDSFCAPSCADVPCYQDSACTVLTSAEGNQVRVCVPVVAMCGMVTPLPDASMTTTGSCGPLAGPTVSAGCHSCRVGVGDCQVNGCYGGWFCNTQLNRCQSPPNPASCGDGGVLDSGIELDAGAPPDGSINASGGTLSELRFAIVGDTRPASQDDTPGYPTAIIDEIWADIRIEHPQFAISTGDYVFARPTGTEADAQLVLYLQARATYSGFVYPAMGNQECSGFTTSNCGPGTADGITNNYQAYLNRMLVPLGPVNPYYTVSFSAADSSWTAKFVIIAANAWNDTQGTWLETQLSTPTTYTFVVRHEGSSAHAPGVAPSEAIIERHPLTLRICGHTHTLDFSTTNKELIVGNGGAPLSSSVNYGYALAERASSGVVTFYGIDYATRGVFLELRVRADGTIVP